MSEDEARKLLAAARRASEQAAASRAKADADSALRREAVRACMKAGIPREEIANTLGVSRQTLYQIVR